MSVDVVAGLELRASRVETPDEWVFVGLGDPVQKSITRGDAYVPSGTHISEARPGSADPDPLHPFAAVGAVTIHCIPKSILR